MFQEQFTTEAREIKGDARTLEFVASTEAVDRYGDLIRTDGWKYQNFLRNPVSLWAHRLQDPPIGKVVGLGLEASPESPVVRVKFAERDTYPFVDTIYKLYKGGYLRAVSVGFKPLKEPGPREAEGGSRLPGFEFRE